MTDPMPSAAPSAKSAGTNCRRQVSTTFPMASTNSRAIARLDDALHGVWRYGRYLLLAWCKADSALEVLVVPNYLPSEQPIAVVRRNPVISYRTAANLSRMSGSTQSRHSNRDRAAGECANGAAPCDRRWIGFPIRFLRI